MNSAPPETQPPIPQPDSELDDLLEAYASALYNTTERGDPDADVDGAKALLIAWADRRTAATISAVIPNKLNVPPISAGIETADIRSIANGGFNAAIDHIRRELELIVRKDGDVRK